MHNLRITESGSRSQLPDTYAPFGRSSRRHGSRVPVAEPVMALVRVLDESRKT